MRVKITNENVMSIDYAETERKAFLKNIPRERKRREKDLAPGLSARGVWAQDVSLMDRRSVKAQLAGRGDYRAAWWNLNQAIHQVLRPQDSLAHAMAAFHTRHHIATICRLLFVRAMLALRRTTPVNRVSSVLRRPSEES